jgi:hypothetical protein
MNTIFFATSSPLPNPTADPLRREHARPAGLHLAEYRDALAGRGNTATHVHQVYAYCKVILDAAKIERLPDLSASAVHTVISELREDRKDAKTAETIRGRSAKTANMYLAAIKAFSRWLLRDRRMAADPLAHLSGWNVEADRRRERRSLTDEELTALLRVAELRPLAEAGRLPLVRSNGHRSDWRRAAAAILARLRSVRRPPHSTPHSRRAKRCQTT